MLTPFWHVPFHAFSELAGSGFLDFECDQASEPDRPPAHATDARADAVRTSANEPPYAATLQVA
jgi:hypothetical protein